MDLTRVYPRRKQLPWRTIDTEALVVDVKSGLLYPLNSVGARIWELCDGERTVAEIVTALADEFEADETILRTDTERFVDELAEAGLISLDGR